MKTTEYQDAKQRYRDEAKAALDDAIEETIRESALPNALAMVGVVAVAFVVNFLLLIVVTGG